MEQPSIPLTVSAPRLHRMAYVRGLYPTAAEQSELRFQLIPSPDQDETLFHVNETSGVMITAVSIDRESTAIGCANIQRCYLHIDVSITSPDFQVS